MIVITDKASEESFDFVSSFYPGVDVSENFGFLYIEVTQNTWFKAFTWFLNLSKHRVLDVAVSDDVHVTFISLFSVGCSSFVFKSRLIEINFFWHNNSLSTEKDLEDCAELGIPVFSCASSPSSQQTKTYLTTGIKIRVESNLSAARCHQIHLWWTVWIIIFAEDIKFVDSVCVGCSCCTSNQSFHQINSVFVNTYENWICMFTWECIG